MATGNGNEKVFKGYGSTYSKALRRDPAQSAGLDAVLGGQVWRVHPDEKAEAKNPCIWMQAGVVAFKSCNNYYDCTSCTYDAAMQRKAEKGKQPSWQAMMRRQQPMSRLCRHSLTGRVPSRLCAYDYQCARCDFDQYLEDYLSPKTSSQPFEVHQVKGFEVPMGYYYHDGHTWARVESGGYVRVGMDDFSLKLLGQMDGFELPVMGKVVEQGAAGWGLKRSGNAAEVLSPVEGIIAEVNEDVREHPPAANQEPYSGGWLFVVRHNDIKTMMKRLMADSDGLEWIGAEVQTLEHMIEEVAGPLAADGGLLQSDVYGNMPQLGWTSLTKTFLKTG
jgi:glycine cleavage system H lipoate-binding protein